MTVTADCGVGIAIADFLAMYRVLIDLELPGMALAAYRRNLKLFFGPVGSVNRVDVMRVMTVITGRIGT